MFVVVPSYFYKRRALAIGLIAAGPGAGVFVMTPIIHNLINAVGWRRTFMVLSGYCGADQSRRLLVCSI